MHLFGKKSRLNCITQQLSLPSFYNIQLSNHEQCYSNPLKTVIPTIGCASHLIVSTESIPRYRWLNVANINHKLQMMKMTTSPNDENS